LNSEPHKYEGGVLPLNQKQNARGTNKPYQENKSKEIKTQVNRV
jgi:hypothetical protein